MSEHTEIISIIFQGSTLLAIIAGWFILHYLEKERDQKRIHTERKINSYSVLITEIRSFLLDPGVPSNEVYKSLELAYSKALFHGSAEIAIRYKNMWVPTETGSRLEGSGVKDLIVAAVQEIDPDSKLQGTDIISLKL